MMTSDFQNLNEVLMHNFVKSRDAIALDYTKDNRSERDSYRQLSHKVYTIVNYLMTDGIAPDDRVVVWMPNSPEQIWVDLGATLSGGIIAPLAMETEAADAAWVINDLQAKYIFVATRTQLDGLLAIRSQLKSVRKVIVLEEIELEDEWMVPFYWMINFPTQINALGNVHTIRDSKIAGSPLCILYPLLADGKIQRRGVVLTHGNCLSVVRSIGNRLGFDEEEGKKIKRYPVMHSFSEVYERTMGFYLLLYYGKTMVIAEPTAARSLQGQWEVTEADFTCLPASHYESLCNQLTASMTDNSFSNWALENSLKVADLQLEGSPISWFLRKKHDFYKGQRENLKRKNAKTVKFFISYGSALQESTAKFFYAMDWHVLQSFGTIETFGFATIDDIEVPQPLTAGTSLAGMEIQIEKYGPILVKGTHVFNTYWKQVRATSQAFDNTGFFRSEVKGYTNTNGCLVLAPPRTLTTTTQQTNDSESLVPNESESVEKTNDNADV